MLWRISKYNKTNAFVTGYYFNKNIEFVDKKCNNESALEIIRHYFEF